jgi:hypothetical protein
MDDEFIVNEMSSILGEQKVKTVIMSSRQMAVQK